MVTSEAPTLRPYQLEALNAITGGLIDGKNRLLVKSPTGTGKTVTFAAMPGHFAPWLAEFPERERKMLVIAHREELLDQAAAKISAQNPTLRVEVEQGERMASRFADVVIASVQTLQASKYRRLARLMAHHAFRIVVVDEAHHSAAPTYRTCLAKLGFLPLADVSEEDNAEAVGFDDVAVMQAALAEWDTVAPKDRLLVGVTATPNRSDAVGLSCVFQSLVFSYALKQAIDDGYLVPIVPWVVETKSSLDDVRTTRGEFNQKDLAEAVNNGPRNALAVAAWGDHAAGLSTIAFTVDVAHAHALAEAFARTGVTAAAVSGETPKDERRSILQAFTDGRIKVVTNCMVLTEGTDLPVASCILHAKPTKSATLYEQMTGRGLRLYPGKERCVVIDLVDVARRHSLQTAPVLYGLPPNLVTAGETLDVLQAGWEDFLEKIPGFSVEQMGRKSLAQLNAMARTFDIWTIPSMAEHGDGLSLEWARIDEIRFRLRYPYRDGNETLLVEPDLVGRYGCTVQYAPAGKGSVPEPAHVLLSDVASANECMRLAEHYMVRERATAARVKDLRAAWKANPMSPKQRAILEKFKVPFNPKMTAGQASGLIDLAFARKGRR